MQEVNETEAESNRILRILGVGDFYCGGHGDSFGAGPTKALERQREVRGA